MPRPKDCEFSHETIVEALKRADFKCERCGIPKEETFEGYLEIHHMLGIANGIKYYPELSHAVIASLMNARVLCCKCHQIEDNEAKYTHPTMAQKLRSFYADTRYRLTRPRISRIA